MTVGDLLHRMSSRELTEWMAYYALEPFGEERGDMRAGIVASTLYNVHRGPKSKAASPEDFMPKFGQADAEGEDEDDEVREQDEAQRAKAVEQKLRAFFRSRNKKAGGIGRAVHH